MREGISSAKNKHLARRIYVELVNQGSLRWQRSWSRSCDPPWSEQDVGTRGFSSWCKWARTGRLSAAVMHRRRSRFSC